jgi:MerR family transcriptional regulator, mercuric resistance operon regulatory protein
MNSQLHSFTIGVLAATAGVNVETIRFYQRKGLMSEPDRQQGSIRRYGESDLARVRFIKGAQRLGFTLVEVEELLRLEDGTHCEEARVLAERKLVDVRERLADLAQIETALGQLVGRCASGTGQMKCPLVASLRQGA